MINHTNMDLALIIDNSHLNSFIAQSIINEMEKIKDSIIHPSGFSAIHYLCQSIDEPQKYSWPDLILLEMAMPVIDGNTFIEEFERFPEDRRKKTSLVILSTDGMNHQIKDYVDKKKIAAFIPKPMRKRHMVEMLQSLNA